MTYDWPIWVAHYSGYGDWFGHEHITQARPTRALPGNLTLGNPEESFFLLPESGDIRAKCAWGYDQVSCGQMEKEPEIKTQPR